MLFGSLDAGRSSFVAVGAKHAPGGPAADGFVALGSVGYGLRPERDYYGDPRASAGARPPRVLRHTVLAGALGGWQWLHAWGVVTLFAGPELAFEVLDSAATKRLPAPAPGLRLHGEVWARPTGATLLTGTLIAGSARTTIWGRASWGARVLSFYVGPEAALYADRTGYRKWSLGLHATDVAVGRVRLRVSAGWVYEEQVRRPGVYGALAVWTPL
ncbi:hypothetical protein OPKNFCMD_3706 [Methylobacterium crusticola]|uniref:Cellulose biosynthesis protein BcsS n=1 Tax=Methylobacterium crusticola TaxID=1697972 RepID=A0ABQ4QZY9_9HYPH|nr:hypothetical protein OPKNFCMD_3706 [Methylobacterium crusticola]